MERKRRTLRGRGHGLTGDGIKQRGRVIHRRHLEVEQTGDRGPRRIGGRHPHRDGSRSGGIGGRPGKGAGTGVKGEPSGGRRRRESRSIRLRRRKGQMVAIRHIHIVEGTGRHLEKEGGVQCGTLCMQTPRRPGRGIIGIENRDGHDIAAGHTTRTPGGDQNGQGADIPIAGRSMEQTRTGVKGEPAIGRQATRLAIQGRDRKRGHPPGQTGKLGRRNLVKERGALESHCNRGRLTGRQNATGPTAHIGQGAEKMGPCRLRGDQTTGIPHGRQIVGHRRIGGKGLRRLIKIQGGMGRSGPFGIADGDPIRRGAHGIQGLQQAQQVGDGRHIVGTGQILWRDHVASHRMAQGDAPDGKGHGVSGIEQKGPGIVGQPGVGDCTAAVRCGIGDPDHLAVQENTRLTRSHLQTKGIGDGQSTRIRGGHFDVDRAHIPGPWRTAEGACSGIKMEPGRQGTPRQIGGRISQRIAIWNIHIGKGVGGKLIGEGGVLHHPLVVQRIRHRGGIVDIVYHNIKNIGDTGPTGIGGGQLDTQRTHIIIAGLTAEGAGIRVKMEPEVGGKGRSVRQSHGIGQRVARCPIQITEGVLVKLVIECPPLRHRLGRHWIVQGGGMVGIHHLEGEYIISREGLGLGIRGGDLDVGRHIAARWCAAEGAGVGIKMEPIVGVGQVNHRPVRQSGGGGEGDMVALVRVQEGVGGQLQLKV